MAHTTTPRAHTHAKKKAQKKKKAKQSKFTQQTERGNKSLKKKQVRVSEKAAKNLSLITKSK